MYSRISSVLLADALVLLASPSRDPQLTQGARFASKCEAAWRRTSISKDEALSLSGQRVEYSLGVEEEFLPQVEELKYVRIFLTSGGIMEWKIEG